MEQVFDIINVVYIREKKGNKKRIVYRLVFFLCLLYIVISLLMGNGILPSIAPIALMLAISLGNLSSGKKGKYKPVAATITLTGEHLEVIYDSIDREDGLGLRREVYLFPWAKVSKAYYAEGITSIRIEGQGYRRICWRSGKRRRDRNDQVRFINLYVDKDNNGELLKSFEQYLRIEKIE